jgi:hypothetical protein
MTHTATWRLRPSLIEPKVLLGTCPSRSCQAVYSLTASGQIPEHPRANRWAQAKPGRCPCSGWLGRNPRPDRFVREGVRWL